MAVQKSHILLTIKRRNDRENQGASANRPLVANRIFSVISNEIIKLHVEGQMMKQPDSLFFYDSLSHASVFWRKT